MDNFEDYVIPMDSDCVSHDFDDYDLYGERVKEFDTETNLELE